MLNSFLLIGTFGISLWNGQLLHYIGFLIFFIPLRIFIGGYHAKRSETCFCLSVATYVITLWIAKNYSGIYQNTKMVVLMTITLIVVFIWSPVKNENHPLTEYQYKRNKIITLGITISEIVMFTIFTGLGWEIASSQMIFILLNGIIFFMGKMSYILKNSGYFRQNLETVIPEK